LFHKYGVAVPEDNRESHTEAPQSVLEACQSGVEAEIENAKMYDRLLELTTDYPDIQSVLIQLQRASTENHLPAFRRCVERGNNQGQGRQHRHGTLPETKPSPVKASVLKQLKVAPRVTRYAAVYRL
jgi:rubrerythrin